MTERLNFYEDIYLSKNRIRQKPAHVHMRQNSAPTYMVYHKSGNPSPPPGNHKTSCSSVFEWKHELYKPTDSVPSTQPHPIYESIPSQHMSAGQLNHNTNLTMMQRITKSADNLRFKRLNLHDQTTALAPYLRKKPLAPRLSEVKQSYSCGSLSQNWEKENNSLGKRPYRRINNKSSMDSVGNESSTSSLDSGNGSSVSVQELRRARSVEPHTLSPIKINTRISAPGGLYPSQKVPRSSPNKTQSTHFHTFDSNNCKKQNGLNKSMQRPFYPAKHMGLHSRENSLNTTTEENEKELSYVQLDLRDIAGQGSMTPSTSAPKSSPRLGASTTKTNARPSVSTQDLGIDNDDSVEYTLINFKATEAVRRASHEHKLYRDRMQWPDTRVHTSLAS